MWCLGPNSGKRIKGEQRLLIVLLNLLVDFD